MGTSSFAESFFLQVLQKDLPKILSLRGNLSMRTLKKLPKHAPKKKKRKKRKIFIFTFFQEAGEVLLGVKNILKLPQMRFLFSLLNLLRNDSMIAFLPPAKLK